MNLLEQVLMDNTRIKIDKMFELLKKRNEKIPQEITEKYTKILTYLRNQYEKNLLSIQMPIKNKEVLSKRKIIVLIRAIELEILKY